MVLEGGVDETVHDEICLEHMGQIKQLIDKVLINKMILSYCRKFHIKLRKAGDGIGLIIRSIIAL